MRALVAHLRLHYQLLFLSPLFAWGFVLGDGRLSERALAAFLAFHVFLYGGISAYNSYYDRDEGPIGGLRRAPAVRPALLGFALVVQLAGLGLATLVGVPFAALYVAVMLLSVVYSHPRYRWKARPLLALVVVAFGQGMAGYLGGWLAARVPPRPLSTPEGLLGLAVATFATVGFYPLTQLYQINEDRARGDRTFSVVFGAEWSFRFALVCLALGGACIVPLVFRVFGAKDALLVALGYAGIVFVVERWRRRFRGDVEKNFLTLHRLQLVFSAGALGYVAFRYALR